MPAVMPPALSAAPSSSSLSTVARGKKRARFADEEESTPGVLRSTSLPVLPTTSQLDAASSGRKIARPGKAGSTGTNGALANVYGAMRREMYMAFIESAFTEKSMGRMDRYSELLAQFQHLTDPTAVAQTSSTAPTNAQIQLWLSALTAVVSRLDRSHLALVNIVLSLPWTVMDDAFVGYYTRFVASLVSARGEWIKLVVDKIVRGFQYRSIPAEMRSGALPGDVTRRAIYNRLHTLLRTLLALVPTLPSTLWPLLEAHFPTKRDHRDAHVCYISNLLRVMLYCPSLESNILETVVGRAIKLDVEIQGEVEDWEDDDGHLETEIFGKSIEAAFDQPWCEEEGSDDDGGILEDAGVTYDDVSSDGGGLTDDEEDAADGPDETTVRKVKEMAAKLDAILRCMFDHLQRVNSSASPTTFSPPPTPLPAAGPASAAYASSFSALPPTLFDPETDEGHAVRKHLFDVLLAVFERTILRTRRTRHTQFVLFWYASLHPDFTDRFLGSLVEAALFDDDAPVGTRLGAVGYVGSLLGRAKYIDRATTRHVTTLLCTRLESELDRFGPASAADSAGATAQQYAMWYAIAQAAFYIFCFRWKDLMEVEEDEEDDPLFAVRAGQGRWLPALKVLERAVSSHLNPLKACAPTVVGQFAKISRQVDFLYCHGIIRANERGAAAVQSSTSLVDPSRPSTPSVDVKPVGRYSLNGSSVMAKASVPPPTSNPLVREVLAEAKMDSFFPFDPYKLPLSAPYLEYIYRVWEGGPQEREEEEDSSESEAGSVVDSEDEDSKTGEEYDDSPRTLAIPLARIPSDSDKLDSGLAGMSISPQPRLPIRVA